jgi:hypothetical protein
MYPKAGKIKKWCMWSKYKLGEFMSGPFRPIYVHIDLWLSNSHSFMISTTCRPSPTVLPPTPDAGPTVIEKGSVVSKAGILYHLTPSIYILYGCQNKFLPKLYFLHEAVRLFFLRDI